MKQIELFFDLLSPYSFFAWVNHLKLKDNIQEPVKFIYRPVLMGSLFSHHGFPGPGEILAKRNYELKKCFRYAHRKHISFRPPEQFPFNPIAIDRCCTMVAAGDQQYQVIDTLFNQIWNEGRVLEDPDLIQEILTHNSLAPTIVESSFTKAAKNELKANIKSALEQQIFGVPSFVYNNEFFWGNDSLDDMAEFIKGNDNWDKDLYNKLIR